jgi:hypothetical protein
MMRSAHDLRNTLVSFRSGRKFIHKMGVQPQFNSNFICLAGLDAFCILVHLKKYTMTLCFKNILQCMICSFASSMFLLSCSNGDQQAQDAPAVKDTVVSLTDSLKTPEIPETPALTAGLEIFQNIEQVEFCIPLPLKDYLPDEKEKQERAHFSFKSKADKKYAIDVQGMFRSDATVSIEKYFENSYPEGEPEGGKYIEAKALVKNRNCFYAKGFWSNFAGESRFIEVTWLRKDDVVKLYADFPIADTSLWNERLSQLVASDSNCR